MPSILLVGSLSEIDSDAKLHRLKVKFGQFLDDVDIGICYYDELRFEFENKKMVVWDCHNNQDLAANTAVIFVGSVSSSTIAYAASRYLHLKGVNHLNDFEAYRPINKLPQLIDMVELEIQFPKSLYLANHECLLQFVTDNWDFPLVLKTINSSQGRFNYLVKSLEELKKILSDLPGERFMVQQFIPNTGDFRILIIGDQEIILRREAASGKYLNNAAQGATITEVSNTELPKKIIKQAHQLASKAKMSIAGVDVVQQKDTDDYYFFEINSQPALGSSQARPYLQSFIQNILTPKNQ